MMDLSSVSSDSEQISPKQKRPRVPLSVPEKVMIRNVYKHVLEERNRVENFEDRPTIDSCVEKTADLLGIGKTSVYSTTREKKELNEFQPPKKPGPKLTFKDKLDDFTFSAIRRKIHGFFLNNEAPTIDKILKAVNDDTELPNFSWGNMRKIVKYLNFKYVTKSRKSVMIDKPEIVLWRHRYLLKLHEFRREGRDIYYQDETWVNEGHTKKKAWEDTTVTSSRQAFLEGLTTGLKNPSGKGKRLIISHIGGEDGFVEEALMVFEAKTGLEDYHQEMNAQCFEEWFGSVLPKLKPNSVVVIDNAPYHSRKLEKKPNMSWTKTQIQEWLQNKNIQFEENMIKAVLINIVKNCNIDNKYAVDEMAAAQGITVLRLPPYHCELNPIELAWAEVKNYIATNNKTFKMKDLKILFQQGIDKVTAEKWKNYIRHVKKEEEKMMQVDRCIDSVADRFLINVTDSDNDDDTTDSDSE